LTDVDQRKFVYRKRYGDLVIHSMAVYAFARKEQIHRFLDFTYQHFTLGPDGCILWGGIQAGYLDPHADALLDQFYQSRVTSQTGCRANVTHLTAQDLSPSYSHLSDDWKEKISLRTICSGRVELSGQGILSG
jgi:hypothetical protein